MNNDIKIRLRQINAIGVAVVVSILAGTVAFGVVPLYRAGKQCNHDTMTLNKQLTELDSLALQVAHVENDKSSREARLASAEDRLPSANSTYQFVQELAKVAEEAGLQVDGVEPAKEQKDVGTYRLMTVHVAGTGTWDTCYHFLIGLRGPNRKLTRLDRLTLETLRDKPAIPPMCQISVDISTLIPR